MPRPRREETRAVRIRQSSYGVAKRIGDQYSLSLTDAVEAAVRAWDLLTEEQKAEITGAEHEATEEPGYEEDEEDVEVEGEGDWDYRVMR